MFGKRKAMNRVEYEEEITMMRYTMIDAPKIVFKRRVTTHLSHNREMLLTTQVNSHALQII